jgi:hypothetical protein
MKENTMGMTCSKLETKENTYKNSAGNAEGKEPVGNLGLGGR